MGKTADWTDVQKTIVDTLHKEREQWKVSAKELVVYRFLYPTIFIKHLVEGKR